jgi:putative ABC transport system permease protein
MRRALGAILGALLSVYPPSFRDRFAADLRSALDDRLDEIARRPVPLRPLLLGRLLADVTLAGLRERFNPAVPAGSPGAATDDRGRGASFMSTLFQDLRFALRSLARRPAFTAVALFTLALGIGGSAAVFTVVNGVLLRPLPFEEPDELFVVWAFDIDQEPQRGWMSQPDISSLRGLRLLDGAEGVMTSGTNVTGTDRPERIDVARSTGGLLTLLGIRPLVGRDLRPEDNSPDAARVVVVSHRFWQTRLGGDPEVVGSTIELNERSWEIVGVAPEGFSYPEGVSLWQPYRLDDGSDGCGRGCHVYEGAVIRLADGVSASTGVEGVGALAQQLAEAYPDTNTDKGLWLEPLIDYEVGDVRTGLWVVLGAVGLVLLIVCANVANLLLVRASGRGREVAVRSAMGASRRRLFTQVATESLVLGGIGGLLGLGLSHLLLGGIRSIVVDRLPRMAEVSIDGQVLLFLLVVTGLVAVLFGASPALHLARRGGVDHLLGGARGGQRGAGRRLRSFLLAVEVAFSVVLLCGAGLLLRSLDRLYAVDLGFDGERVTRFTLSLPSARYAELATIVPFFDRLEANLAELPGVESVGSVYGAPLGGGNISGSVLVEGRPDPAPGEETSASMRPTTPDYFDAMGLRLVRGRGIDGSDVTESEPVAVVNETFVRQNFPNEEVLGARVRVTADFGFGSPYWRVVGVVGDVRRSMSGQPTAGVYVPHSQYGPGFMTVHVRSGRGAPGVVPRIRETVAGMDPNLVLRSIETVSEAKRRDTASTRLFLSLVGFFACVAIVLAAVGLYGVVAFLVSQRTREIGIRMALGARRASVTGMILRQGLRPTILGVLAGILITLAGGRLAQSLLFGVEPGDPLVLGVVGALVAAIAAAATLLPARRATRVNPTVALSVE